MQIRLFATLILLAFGALQTPAQEIDALLNQLRGRATEAPVNIGNLNDAYNKALDHLIPMIAGDDVAQRYGPQILLQDIGSHASRPGAEKERKALVQCMLARLGEDTPLLARIWIVRQLERIGDAESVPTLVKLMAHEDAVLSEDARRALQQNPSAQAAKSLRDTLKNATDPVEQIGLISALGARGDIGGVELIAGQLRSPDPRVIATAAEALAKIRDEQAVKYLLAARNKVPAASRLVVSAAGLQAAENYLKAGDNKHAVKIYAEFGGHNEPSSIRIGAMRGLILAQPQKASTLIVNALSADNPKERRAIVELAQYVDDNDLPKKMAGQLHVLPPDTQVQVLGYLAGKADLATQSAVIKATQSQDEAIQVAAIRALGKMENAASVKQLLSLAATASGDTQKAARNELTLIHGTEVDQALLQMAKAGESSTRIEAIDAVVRRKQVDLLPDLMNLLSESDETVRKAALKAVGAMAGQKELPVLVGMLAKAPDPAQAKQVGATVKSICGRLPDRQASVGALVSSMENAPPQSRIAVLDILSGIGGKEALDAASQSVSDSDAEVRDGAIRALSGWPDYRAVDALLVIAKDPNAELKHHVLAMRGIKQLVASSSDRPAKQRLNVSREAMKAARRVDEKKMMLTAFAGIPDRTSADIISAAMKDPALRSEAAGAAVQLAERLGFSDLEAARDLVQQVKALPDRPELHKRADQVLAKVNQYREWILEWEISGPYKGKKNLFDQKFDPEKPGGGNVKWRKATAKDRRKGQPYIIDFLPSMRGDNRVAYLRATIQANTAYPARLELGSDDGAKVWLNGKQVHTHNGSRSLTEGEDKVRVHLKTGDNVLLMKITQGSGDWAACAKLVKEE